MLLARNINRVRTVAPRAAIRARNSSADRQPRVALAALQACPKQPVALCKQRPLAAFGFKTPRDGKCTVWESSSQRVVGGRRWKLRRMAPPTLCKRPGGGASAECDTRGRAYAIARANLNSSRALATLVSQRDGRTAMQLFAACEGRV